jgi:molybdopterin-guanine dinucleotide biosynthesis protein A
MNLSAIILAGGQSRRMGRDKAWVEWDGQPLAAVALEKVRRLGVREMFLSGRAGTDYSALKCPVLLDREPGLGPVGGIERGLGECRSPLLLVLAVDLAQMTTEFLQKLAAQCDPLTGVVPEVDGGLEPLAAIYPKRCHALAGDAIAQSRLSARGFAEACQRDHAVCFWPVPAAETNCFANWNRPADIPIKDREA